MYKIESFIAMGCAHSLHCEDDFMYMKMKK